MPQFYLPPPWETQKPHPLTPELLHHLRVRRIAEGQSIPIFDGAGQTATATLVRLGSKAGELTIAQIQTDTAREPSYGITLAQGLAGGDKMDWVIEKAVETGAKAIAPLQCERSVIKLTRASDADRAEKRRVHWQAITQAACEQCERTVLPVIERVQTITDYLSAAAASPALKFILCPGNHPTLVSAIRSVAAQNTHILIGPEGGFTPEEVNLAMAAGFKPVSLGSRILRTETAGIVAISSIHAIWDC